MAIQRLRDGTQGILAKVIVGLIIIVFALFGFGSITTFLAPVPKVAVINGEEITQQAMELAVERSRRLLLAQDINPQDIDEDRLREDVLESLITRTILSQAADDMDLYYSDQRLDDEIVATEIFQVDGVFNAEQFQMVIGGAGYSPMRYREEMRTDKLFGQMMSGIRQTSFLTPAEAKRYTGLSLQRRDLAYLQIKADMLLDQVTVTDEEIDEFYRENPQEFVTEETVSLEYVELKLDDLASNVEATEADLQLYYEENKDLYATDESRRVAHILVEVSDEVTEDSARQKIDEIYAKIVDGEDFSKLAEEFSDDPGSARNGGDLGFSEPGTFVEEFEAVAFDLNLNEVSKPVLTEFGYHIIKVTGIEEANTPTLDEIRESIERGYRNTVAEDEFVTLSARLAELVFESIDLEVPAAELGLGIKTTGHVSRDESSGIMGNRAVVEAAFSPDVLIDGNNSDLLEITDNYHLTLRVVEHIPSATKQLDEVREDVRYILLRQKATDLAESQTTEIVNEIESGSLAVYVADQHGLEWRAVPGANRTQPDVDPVILREAFSLPRPVEGKESLGQTILANGDSVVLRVSRVTNDAGDLSEQELAALARALSSQLGTVDFQEFENSLSANADLERIN